MSSKASALTRKLVKEALNLTKEESAELSNILWKQVGIESRYIRTIPETVNIGAKTIPEAAETIPEAAAEDAEAAETIPEAAAAEDEKKKS